MPRYADLTDLEWNTCTEIFNERPGLGTTSLKPVLEGGFPDLCGLIDAAVLFFFFSPCVMG